MPLQITVFAEEANFQRYRERLNEYEYASKKVSTDYVDPDKKPALASQNQIQQYGTILFDYKGRTERVTSDAEQDITTGIIKVVQGQQKKVYFTQGHGEKDTASAERDGYKDIADGLGRDNYTVDKRRPRPAGAVARRCGGGHRRGAEGRLLLPREIDALKKYLDKSGKLLLEIDPPEKPDSAPAHEPDRARSRLGRSTIGNDIVVDASGMGQLIGTDASVPLAASYPSHAITQRLKLITGYPLARSVTAVMGGVNGHTAQGFVETSPRSWAESDIKGLLTSGKVSMDAASGDKPGPDHGRRGGVGDGVLGSGGTRSRARPTGRNRKRGSSCSAIRISPRTRPLPASRAIAICS